MCNKINIIKKGFTVFLIVLSCFGVLSSVPAYAVHSGGGGSLFGGTEGDTITGADLKAMAADYNSCYCPMPTSDAFVWGYHSSTSIDQKGSSSAYDFYPDVPVYMDTRSWGGKAWLDFYVLPYYYDDNNSLGTFYGNYYFHVYAKNVNGSVTLYLDSYNLSDNILDRSFNSSWNVSNYPYLGFYGKNNVSIRGYTSNGNYYSRTGSALITMNCPSFTSIDRSVTGQIGTLIVSSTFTPDSNINDDWGFIVQNTPFELFANQTQIDFNQIPDNYVITINGDTIYDYSITNPDTGDSTTINNYITNNYTIPASDDPTNPTDPTDPSDPTSPSITGNVTVSGNVDVSGKIDIDTKPIDINVNVNSGGSDPDIPVPTLEGLEEGQQGINDLINYYQDSADQIGGFFSSFMSIVPAPIRNMVPVAVGLIIFLGLVHILRR